MNTENKFTYWTQIVTLGIVFGVGLQITSAAWTAPTGAPPTNNTSAPITVSATNQVKSGGLGIRGNLVVGGLQLCLKM